MRLLVRILVEVVLFPILLAARFKWLVSCASVAIEKLRIISIDVFRFSGWNIPLFVSAVVAWSLMNGF